MKLQNNGIIRYRNAIIAITSLVLLCFCTLLAHDIYASAQPKYPDNDENIDYNQKNLSLIKPEILLFDKASNYDIATAKKYIKKNKRLGKIYKIDKGNFSPPLSHSFIVIDDSLYIIGNLYGEGVDRHGEGFLGIGGYGEVMLIENEVGNKYALKVEGITRLVDSELPKSSDDASIDEELMIMEKLGLFIGSFTKETGKFKIGKWGNEFIGIRYLIQKLIPGEDLRQFIKNNPEKMKDEAFKLQVAKLAAIALKKVHDHNFVHRDIHAENFMIDYNEDKIQISTIDFGITRLLGEDGTLITPLSRGRSHPYRQAPEIKNEPYTYSKKSDIYALGALFKSELNLNIQEYNVLNLMLANLPSDRPELRTVLDELNRSIALWEFSHSYNQNKNNQDSPYIWITVGENNVKEVKAITSENECPQIEVNGKLIKMQPSLKDNKPQKYSEVTSCIHPISDDQVNISLKDIKLNNKKTNYKKIAVLADTGCRVKNNSIQNCNAVSGYGPPWPFPKLINNVSSHNPDLVIHLGDYFYREQACPNDNAGCNGPTGDNWKTWEADFFKPARQLLLSTPWVFARGNHEVCSRGGDGWFYFLSPQALSDEYVKNDRCIQNTRSYVIPINEAVALIIMDSGDMPRSYKGIAPDPDATKYFQIELDRVNELAAQYENVILISHRPFWAMSYLPSDDTVVSGGELLPFALSKTKLGKLHENIKLILSGHFHIYEAISFKDNRPPQLVLGSGGTKNDPEIIRSKLRQEENNEFPELDKGVDQFFYSKNFYFAIVEQLKDRWKVGIYNLENKKHAEITISKEFIYKNIEN